MDTEIIVIENKDTIELHFEGDIIFKNVKSNAQFEHLKLILIGKGIDLIAYSGLFKEVEK